MSFLKHVWIGHNKVYEIVCCERLVNSEDICKQNDIWHIFCEGCYLYQDINFCPFCGAKLPNPSIEFWDSVMN